MEEQDNSDSSVIVARADALMQRRRPSFSPQPGETEDLPILTDVVAPDQSLHRLDVAPWASTEEESSSYDPAVLDILAHELARRLQERLADEIPDLVATALQSALAGLTDELRQGLANSTEDTIRDFLAERDRLAKIQRGE